MLNKICDFVSGTQSLSLQQTQPPYTFIFFARCFVGHLSQMLRQTRTNLKIKTIWAVIRENKRFTRRRVCRNDQICVVCRQLSTAKRSKDLGASKSQKLTKSGALALSPRSQVQEEWAAP